MASETVKLSRNESTPWGFRLAGGKDFGVVLSVQKVNPGSLADQNGIKPGDTVIAINGQDTTTLRHKEAQDAIIRAGNLLELTIQKGGLGSIKPASGIAKKIQGDTPLRAPAAGEKVTAVVHQNYNSPVAMYSMNVIAETLSAHAEMIAPGVMGINFMKPEKPINTMSEVYRLVQEEETTKGSSPTPPVTNIPIRTSPRAAAPSVKTPPPVLPKPSVPAPSASQSAPAAAPQGTCTDCGRFITGVFVKLNDRMLHEECFKCSTCGNSLKNMGYININNKLYCDVHARLAAKVIGPDKETAPAPPAPVAPSVPFIPKPVAAPSASVPAPSVAPAPVFTPAPMPHSTPTPFSPQVKQSLGNLPQTPSSSGGLPFRSISPQPFKRLGGDYHRVTAPTSPTPTGSTPPSFPQSGPLPFEMTPYMPPERSKDTTFSSSSQTTEVSHMSQMTRQTTRFTQQSQQSSHFQVDYQQVVGPQRTKFVWPPPKPSGEQPVPVPVLESNATPTPPTYRPPPGTQHYSPLVMQSMPAETNQTPSFQSVQPPSSGISSTPKTSVSEQAPQPFVPPPLPSSFIKPQDVEPEPPKAASEISSEPLQTQQLAPLPVSTQSGPVASGFSPVLPPVIDPSEEPKPVAPQAGVPTGAGSRPAPKRGRGQIKEQTPGARIPICADCGSPIRGPFVTALGKTWCPDHFHCNNIHCKMPLQDIGFVEEQGQLYCENCYEAFLAPICNKCGVRIKGDCLNALDKQWHPACFICAYCQKPFGNNSFYLEDGLPYCEKDWNELFTTKCVGCGYPIEAGDRWVEALNNNYHSQCFKCSICNKNLEGQSFFAKGGRPFCKAHAR